MDEWDTLSTKTETNVKLKGSKMSINTTKTETETDVKPKGSDMSNDTNPLRVDPVDTITAQDNPRQASQKYSYDENFIANSASTGADKASTIDPMTPPMTAHTKLVPSASSALPLRVSA